MPFVLLNGQRRTVRFPAPTGSELKQYLGLKQRTRLFCLGAAGHKPGLEVTDTDHVVLDGTTKLYTEGP